MNTRLQKHNATLRTLLFLAFFGGSLLGWGQYSVNFEGASETKVSYTSGNVTLSGIEWNLNEALIGDTTNDWKNGNRSARLRGRNGSVITMNQNKTNGAGTVSFSYRIYGTDGSQQPWAVEYSNNGGTWTQLGANITGTATVQNFSGTLNLTGDIKIRIRLTTTPGTSGDRRLNIDDITITDYTGSSCSDVSISSQPTNSSITEGYNTSFTITASNVASYQWQVDTGSGYSDVTNTGVYSGATTATLSITTATLAMNGYKYKVVMTPTLPCTGATSSEVTLTVNAAVYNFSVGDISIVGTTADIPDSFSFVSWVNIPAGAQLSFTDNTWDGTALLTNENTVVWENNTGSAIAAGTVIIFTDDTGTFDLGTKVSGAFDGFSSSDDNLFIYEGTPALAHFIFGLSMANWLTTYSVSTNTSMLPTALNVTNGNIVIGTLDNNEYSGSRSNQTVMINYRALVNNPVNWTGSDTYFALSSTDFTLASTSPTITTSVSSLTGFTTSTGTASAAQTYTVSADNLTANVTVTAPTDFEVSTDGVTYTASVSLAQSGGNLTGEPVTVYVRIAASAGVGSPSGNITHVSTGATSQNVAVDGTVTSGGTSNCIDETFSSTSFPSGWTQNSAYVGNTAGIARTGTYYAGMNAANDWIMLPELTDPTELNVYVRTSTDPDNWVVTIQSSTSTSGPWTDHGTITENGSGGTISNSYTLITQNLNLIGNYYVRLFMTSRSDGSAYFDDFIVTCGSSSPAPEINITGNSTNIIDGDATPDVADHTDFGSVDVSTSSQAYTFTIENLGSATLNIDSVTSDNTEFAVSAISTPTTVASSSSTTFVITFNPASTGVRTATITIENNDSDEDPYTFAVQGTGVNSTESDIIAVAASEAVSISSLENDVTVSAITDGTQVWQFTIRDGGADLTDTDTFATVVTALTFAQGSGNQVTTWTDAIQSIALFDGSTFIANATVTANQIQFTGLNINVADGTQKTISVRLSLKNPLGADAFDGEDFVFSLSNANTTASSAGSGFSLFTAAASTNGSNVIDVTATQLSFSVQPTDVGVGSVMNPNPAVKATDVNGNLDLGFTGNVALTSTGTETVTTPVTAVAGMATFEDLVHTVIGTTLTLSATASGLTGVTSITFDVLEQTTFQVGDLAILAINTDIDNDPGGTGNGSGDQIVFVSFKDITQGTKLYITDNGYERELAGKWGNTEGVIAITRTGSTLAKGTVITLEANASTNGNILSSNHFSIFTCGSLDSNWSKEYVAGTGGLNLNSDDDVWIMQGGTWTNGNSGDHDATYDGTVLYGWTESGWNDGIGPGSDGPKWSNLIEGMSCFSTEVTGDSKVKFDDPVDPDFSTSTRDQLDWVALINDTANWDTYADNATYNTGGYNYKGNTTCPAITIAADTHVNGKWIGTEDTNWFNCANWDYLKVPDETIDVIISGSATNEAVVDADATDSNLYGDIAKAKNLTIQNGNYVEVPDATDVLEVNGNLTIDSGAALYMNGSTAVDGTLHLFGNWINNASEADFYEGESTVHFLGTTAQTVTCNTGTEVEHFYNVVLDNPNGFTTDSFNDDLHAEGDLTLSQGNLLVKTGHYALAANNLNVATGSQITVTDKGSLIQTGLGTVTGGDATAFKIIKTTGSYYNYDYIYWSSPVEGLNIQDVFATANGFNSYKYKFAPDKFKDIKKGIRTGTEQPDASAADGFDDNGDDWATYSSGVMDKGLGYIVMGQGSPSSFSSTNINTTHSGYTVNFTGQKVNNGSIDVTLYEDKYNLDGGTVPNAYNINLNLVGNPYPSAISTVELYNDNSSNIEPKFYFWTHEHPISNTFVGPWGYNFSNNSIYSATVSGSTVTTVNPLGNNPLSLDYTYIASGQAFFVQAKNGITSGTTQLNFNNSMRNVTNPNISFLKTNNDDSLNRIWLSMTEINGDKNFIALGFGANNTDDLSLNDVYRMDSGNDTEFYSLIPQVQGDFDIQFLSEFSDDKTIPLGVEIRTAGSYAIQIEQTEGVFIAGQKIYLEDTYLDIIHEMGMGPYTFTQTVGENINDRFILRFTNSALGNEDTLFNQVKVYPNPSTGVFNVSYQGSATLQYTVYDLTGKTVLTGSGNQINLSQQAIGLYVAKITDGSAVRSLKLVIE